jgi:hypothetical protein
MHAQVAPEAFDRVIAQIAIAAEQLARSTTEDPLSVASFLAIAEKRVLSGAPAVTLAAAR